MGRVCELTGRKTMTGHRKKHRRGSSGGGGVWRFRAPKTKRTFKPNLRKLKVIKDDGTKETITVSMKAYKRIRQEGGTYKGFTLVHLP